MSIGIVLAGLLAAAGPVAEASNPQAVTAYPAAFFAPSQPNTALDMLTRLPGFTLNGGSAVRGFGDAAGNVLIDGERQTAKDDSLDEVIKRIPASAVLRIELIRSGAPGIDMQGKTLLANIVRRKDRGVKLAVSVSGTRWYDGRLGRGLRVEGETRLGATRIEGALALDRGIDDAAGDGTRIVIDPNSQTIKRYGEHNAGDTRTYKLTAAVEAPLWGGSTRLNGSLSSAPYRLLQDDDPLASGAADSLDVFNQNHKTGEIGLRYNHALGAKASVETVVLQQFGHYKQTDDFTAGAGVAHLRLVKKTSESIARVTIKYDPTITLSLQTGVEGDYNWLRAATAYAIDGVAVGLPAANVRVSETRGEGFVTATWRPTAKLAVETGLRIEASRIVAAGDVVSNRNFVYFKPRAVLTWSPDAADQIRARVEREVGQLNFDDFTAGQAALANSSVHAGNPTLTPQKAWVFEGALEHKMWGSSDATVTFRHYVLTDIIDRAPLAGTTGLFDAPGNIGGGRKDEIAVAFTLPTDRLGLPRGLLTGATTWRWSRVVDPATLSRRPISGLHPADAELHFSQGLPVLKTTWGVDVFDQWKETYYRFNEIDIDKKKIYVSVFADYKPRADLSLRIELENLGARGFSHTREIYAIERDVTTGPTTDIRNVRSGRGIYFRLRKTFG